MKRSCAQFRGVLLLWIVSAVGTFAPAEDRPARCFAIEVVDQQTGRGVPLVELKTVSNVSFFTDSAGVVAIDDPSLLGREVYFSVSSPGYEYPADGLAMRGFRAEVEEGGSTKVRVKRLNVAERLYRITGEGIYRDSVMLGRPTPIPEPLLNGQVTGQDSSQSAVYGGKIHWFWGDTARQSYPLGHFGTAGAVSELPGSGGVDPAAGIALKYFTEKTGFSRPMVPDAPEDLRWVDAVAVVKDASGREHLVARVSFMKGLDRCVGRQLIGYDDKSDTFQKLVDIPVDRALEPCGHSCVTSVSGRPFLLFGECFANVRCGANLESFLDVSKYEGFTCLRAGTRFKGVASSLDRDAAGRLIWGWKRDVDPLSRGQVEALVKAGVMKGEEAWPATLDVETKKPINLVSGSVAFNGFRNRWVAIAGELRGSSSELGEIWYSEADEPQGPWRWARKIVTHDRYSFYNPVQDTFFAKDNGREVYFEGTYTTTFSGNEHPTPRYEYNQMMYRLDLADPRLKLPAE